MEKAMTSICIPEERTLIDDWLGVKANGRTEALTSARQGGSSPGGSCEFGCFGPVGSFRMGGGYGMPPTKEQLAGECSQGE